MGNYICEGQTLVLPCSVLSTIYYQLLLLELLLMMKIIVDESINESYWKNWDCITSGKKESK